MQVRKVAVVATGALATAAAMGSTPAFATDSSTGIPEIAPAIAGVLDYQGKHRASDQAMREVAEQWLTSTPEGSWWSAPWDQDPPQILSVGSGSALSLAPFQQCGSTGPWGAGVTVPVASPATVLGDCRNGNIDLGGSDGDDALLSILDNTAISGLSWQMCGSSAGGILVGNAPLASPATVMGSCDNGNITVGESDDHRMYIHDKKGKHGKKHHGKDDLYGKDGPYGKDHGKGGYDYHEPKADEQGAAPGQEEAQEEVLGSAPWDADPPQILSAGSGSVASGASFQQCASTGAWALGLTAPIASPATVLDKCRNGNIDIHGEPSDALFSLLDHSAVSALSWQMCGSGAGGILVGNVPIASPTTAGGCDNGNISVD